MKRREDETRTERQGKRRTGVSRRLSELNYGLMDGQRQRDKQRKDERQREYRTSEQRGGAERGRTDEPTERID